MRPQVFVYTRNPAHRTGAEPKAQRKARTTPTGYTGVSRPPQILAAKGQSTPTVFLSYRYLRRRNARPAPTAMPRAKRAISLATRWRSTCTLLS